jgi:hypothetical protein
MRNTIAAAATLAALAIALAAPASADPVMSGMYKVHYTDGNASDTTFKATPCGPGCTQVIFTDASAQANLTAGQWSLDFPPDPAAWRCATDGTMHNGVDHWRWDAVTLAGSRYVTHIDAACGFAAGSDGPSHPFTLTSVSSGQ